MGHPATGEFWRPRYHRAPVLFLYYQAHREIKFQESAAEGGRSWARVQRCVCALVALAAVLAATASRAEEARTIRIAQQYGIPFLPLTVMKEALISNNLDIASGGIGPMNMMKFALFMERTGSIKEKPAEWKEPFFRELHAHAGS
jgi:hypothetical protein